MNFILKGLALDELENFLVKEGYSKYRAQQIYTWLYKHGTVHTKSMSNLSDRLKSFLDENCIFKTLFLSKKI